MVLICTMSVIINGKQINIPGLNSVSYLDGIKWLKQVTDFNHRSESIRMITAHTHKGIKGNVLPGLGPNTTIDEANARYQVNTDRTVSYDYGIDQNGDVSCQNDPVKKYTWHAGSVNPRSLGFELIQTANGDLYEGQIQATVLFIDALTALLGIQRQIPWDRARNAPKVGVVARIASGGQDVVGIIGHRNQTTNKGPGDPGDALFLALRDAGYECFDMDKGEDQKAWKERQRALGIKADGDPLKATVQALKNAGHKHGMWVKRPIDDLL